MAKYGKKASEKVEKAMRERKKGTLKSGRSGKKVKSRKQAIAIGLSQARRAGAKVPRKKSSSKKKITAGCASNEFRNCGDAFWSTAACCHLGLAKLLRRTPRHS